MLVFAQSFGFPAFEYLFTCIFSLLQKMGLDIVALQVFALNFIKNAISETVKEVVKDAVKTAAIEGTKSVAADAAKTAIDAVSAHSAAAMDALSAHGAAAITNVGDALSAHGAAAITNVGEALSAHGAAAITNVGDALSAHGAAAIDVVRMQSTAAIKHAATQIMKARVTETGISTIQSLLPGITAGGLSILGGVGGGASSLPKLITNSMKYSTTKDGTGILKFMKPAELVEGLQKSTEYGIQMNEMNAKEELIRAAFNEIFTERGLDSSMATNLHSIMMKLNNVEQILASLGNSVYALNEGMLNQQTQNLLFQGASGIYKLIGKDLTSFALRTASTIAEELVPGFPPLLPDSNALFGGKRRGRNYRVKKTIKYRFRTKKSRRRKYRKHHHYHHYHYN
jgi:hypothetical protein